MVHIHAGRSELRTLSEVHRLATCTTDVLRTTLELMADMPQVRIRETAQQILRALDTEEAMNILSNLVKGTEHWSLSRATGPAIRQVEL